MKETIIYIGNIEFPDKSAAAHRVMNNGKIFESLGYRVLYIGITKDASFEGLRRSEEYENIFEKAYPGSFSQWQKHLRDQSAVRKLVDEYGNVKAVIVYNLAYAGYKAVKRAFRGTDVTVAYDCTEWETYSDGFLIKRWYKRFDEWEIRMLLPRKCGNMIVVSRMMQKHYRGVNLLLLPPLVDTDDPIWNQETPEKEDTFDFFFAGSITKKERLDIIIDVFHDIDNPALRLNVAGLSKQEYLDEYPHHKAILDEDKRISFLGMLSHWDTIGKTLVSDCVIFIRDATRKNNAGFPTKFAEAYTCGTPIITTNVSDIAGYMTSKEKGIVIDHAEPELIKAAMEDIYSGGHNNKELNKSFDYRNHISETEEWMNRLS